VNDEENAILLNDTDKEGETFSPLQRRVLGVGMAVLAGIFYGTNFDPPQYLIDNCETCSKTGLDYVFPHFCGIFITSTVAFLGYCVIKRNKPHVPSEVAYPGFLSGIMWALADVCWFIANSSLSLIISFPIITIMPGVVASIWGIVVFKELKGQKNYIIFAIGFSLSVLSVIFTVISQVK